MAGQGKPWLYFVIDEQGRSFSKNMGIVMSNSDRVPLKHSPIGWQDVSIAWERDLTKWGITRTFTLPLGFVLEAADIMRNLFYRSNFERKIYLLIQKQYLILDSIYYYYQYDLFYKGLLDFTTTVDEQDKVTVSVNQGGITQDLKANTATEYEIPVDEVTIKMDGINLFESVQMYCVPNLEIAKSVYNESFMIPLTPYGAETSFPGMLFSEETLETTGDSVAYVNDPNQANYFGIADGLNSGPLTLHIYGTLKFTCSENDLPFGVRFRVMTSTMTTANQSIYQPSTIMGPAADGTTVYSFPMDFNVVLQPKEKVFLRGAFTGGVTGAIDIKIKFTEDSFLKVDYQYRKAPTFVKALFPLTLFQRLMAKISPGAVATSQLLTTFRHFCLTSGDGLRGLTGAVIKINFDDFYQSVFAELCSSLQINGNTISIEQLSDALVEANAIALGEPADLKVEVTTDIIYNTIKVGYPEQTYDDVNGKQEFNNTTQYTSDIKKIVKELDLTSKARGDSFGATFTWQNLAGKNTTDADSDNDTFWLDIDVDNPQTDPNVGTYYNLYRETYTTITGVLSPSTIFNVRLSPARMMARNAPLINSIFYGFEGSKLVFQTTDKNRLLFTQGVEGTFDEDADITISSDQRLFIPRTFDFQPQTPTRLSETLAANPNRCFSFVHYNGRTYKGFGIKIGLAANTLESQAYLLLSCASNDLTTLTT